MSAAATDAARMRARAAVRPHGSHMADLAFGPRGLAVEVDGGITGGHAVGESVAGVDVGPSPTTFTMVAAGTRSAVDPSGRSATARRCCSNCEVVARLDREVAAVVDPRRELVDVRPAVDDEQLDRQHARRRRWPRRSASPTSRAAASTSGADDPRARAPRGTCRDAARSRRRGRRRVSPPGRRATSTATSQLDVEAGLDDVLARRRR